MSWTGAAGREAWAAAVAVALPADWVWCLQEAALGVDVHPHVGSSCCVRCGCFACQKGSFGVERRVMLGSMVNGYISEMVGVGEDGAGWQTQTASTEESVFPGAVCTPATGGLPVCMRCRMPNTRATQSMRASTVVLLDNTGPSSPCIPVMPAGGIHRVCCLQ